MCRKGKILLASAAMLMATAGVSGVLAVVPDPVEAAAWQAESDAEYQQTIQAMKPPKRARPVVAVLGDNRGTEAIDFLIPYGVFKQSGVADVYAVAIRPGPLKLRPALTIKSHLTADELDAKFPDGADYVVVPAMFDHETPEVIKWITSQAAKGATIVAVCSGAEILANAGLLKDRAATTHWASVGIILKTDPTIRWQPHRRYVADRGVVTTTGVTAAMPVSIALVEAIAGRKRAKEVAAHLGVSDWSRRHDSNRFALGKGLITGLRNKAAEWGKQEIGIPVASGVDDIALGLSADAWSRTYRSQALTVAQARTVRTLYGLELVVDRHGRQGIDRMIEPVDGIKPAQMLDRTLGRMSEMYGEETAKLVAVQLEYDR